MKKFLFTSIIGLATVSFANQETPTTSAMELTQEEAEKAPEGMLPFLGLGGGYTGYDTLGAVEGTPATLKLLGSYYFENPFVADIGYGVNNQQFTQASGNQDTAMTGGAFEIAARYRWDNRWQAGIVANHLFEQGKNLSAEQGDAQFAGLQVLREFNMTSSWLARIGARAMGLTNNTGNLVTMYLVDLQIGWNPGAYKPSVRQTAETPVQRPVASERFEPARPITQVQPASPLKDIAFSNLMASAGTIQFSTARASISNKDEQKLSRVAKVLSENKDLFDRVEVYGFTDSSGSSTINQKISQERANQVRSILRKGGLSGTDVVAVGKGSSESTGNMAEDRRAELIFIGVKDEQKLREALSQVE